MAVLVVLLVRGGVEYSFKHTALSYTEIGTMVFISPPSGAPQRVCRRGRVDPAGGRPVATKRMSQQNSN